MALDPRDAYNKNLDQLGASLQSEQQSLFAQSLQQTALASSAAKADWANPKQQGAAAQASAAPASGQPAPASTQAPTPMQPAPQQPASTVPSPFAKMSDAEFQQYMKNLDDPATGQPRPPYADGLSPNSPINKSPVSIMDRFDLAFGNNKGAVNFLKQKFQDAQVQKDGTVSVKQNGLWYRVDPNGLGDGNAWDKTKELLTKADTASAGVMKMGGLIGADLLSGGMGVVGNGAVAGGLEMARTSMGRIYGTYDATPQDQIKDAAAEGLFTSMLFGGAKIAEATGSAVANSPMAQEVFQAGKQITGQTIAGIMNKAAPMLDSMSTGTKRLLASVFGESSGIGEANSMRAFDRPRQVAAHLSDFVKSAPAGASGPDTYESAQGRAAMSISDDLNQFGQRAQKALSKFYNDGLNRVQGMLKGDFQFKARTTVEPLMQKMLDDGLVTKTSGQYALKPFAEINKLPTSDPALQEFGTNAKAYGQLRQAFGVLNKQLLQPTTAGSDGLLAMRNTEQMLRGTLDNRVPQALFENNTNNAARYIRTLYSGDGAGFSGFNKALEDHVAQGMQNPDAYKAYTEMKAQYGYMKSHADGILDQMHGATTSAERSKAVLQLFSRLDEAKQGAASRVSSSAFHYVTDTLGKIDPTLKDLGNQVMDKRAAMAAIPKIKPSSVKFIATEVGAGAVSGAIGYREDGMTGALVGAGATMGGIGLATSPRLISALARGAGSIADLPEATQQAVAKKWMMGLQFMKTLRAQGKLGDLLSNEAALKNFAYGLYQTPDIHGAANQLVQQGIAAAHQKAAGQ